MTGPNPDAELDAALGIDDLPPADVTAAHMAIVEPLWATSAHLSGPEFARRMAQLVADAEQRGAARVLAEHAAAGTALPETPHG
jgi:hypothetical protein